MFQVTPNPPPPDDVILTCVQFNVQQSHVGSQDEVIV